MGKILCGNSQGKTLLNRVSDCVRVSVGDLKVVCAKLAVSSDYLICFCLCFTAWPLIDFFSCEFLVCKYFNGT